MALQRVVCPVCGSARARFVFDAFDYVYRVSADRFMVQCCRDCGAGYLSPRPSPDELARYYPSEFYWNFEHATAVPLSRQQLLLQRLPQITAKLSRMAHLPRGRLLDIGTMKGEFLSAARDAGWRVQGVEFGDHVPNMFAVPIHYGEFLDMDFAPGSVDCVTMWAVLEHVYEPREYVRKIAKVLSDGGRFTGVVTNFNSIHARWLRADDFPRHLTMFTKSSLGALLRESGLQPLRMWTDQKLFGGALRGAITYAVKRLRGYEVDEALYEMRDWHDPEAFCCKFRGGHGPPWNGSAQRGSAVLWLPGRR